MGAVARGLGSWLKFGKHSLAIGGGFGATKPKAASNNIANIASHHLNKVAMK